jgi:hypothetical protein
VVPFAFTRFGRDEIQGGDQRFYLAGVRMHFTRQGFFRVDGSFGKEPWAGQTFDVHSTRLIAEGQPVRWLNLNAYYSFGQSVYYDATNPFVGHSRNLSVGGSFQPSSRFNQTVSWDHASFDRLTGEPVYAVDVLNLRSTFLFDRHFLLRAIVQYDSSKRQVLTDVLGSFELRPGHRGLRGLWLVDRAARVGRCSLPAGPRRLPDHAARLLLQGVVQPPLLGGGFRRRPGPFARPRGP